jgi:hypothetical protein
VDNKISGFATKHHSGDTRFLGKYDEQYLTAWIELGGPVIGFEFKGADGKWPDIIIGNNMSLIVGDRCRPRYFGARKLSVRLGEKQEVQFYWQETYADYFSACLSNGLFYIHNSGKLNWIVMGENRATIFPLIENVYSSKSYLSISYKGETKLLNLSVFVLYQIPPTSSLVTPIATSFGDIEEIWLPASSKFKFSDNLYDFKDDTNVYEEIMFNEFEQAT